MSVKFNSSGGGSVTLDAPSTASNLTVTLPSASGTLVSTGSPFSGGTANGVVYLNGSSVPTAGSALTFDGTSLSTTGAVSIKTANYMLRFFDATGVTSRGYIWSTSSDFQLDTGSTAPLEFLINGSEGMRLTSTGLGIGTSSPSAKLHVVASTNQAKFEGADQGGLIIQKTSTNGYELFSNVAGTLGFYDINSSVTRMFLDASGYLGVGIGGAPVARLHVTGSSNTYTGSGLLLGQAGVSSGFISTTDNLYIKPNTSANTTSGDVNIQAYNGSTMILLRSGTGSIGLGGATPPASGAGITFPATQSASSDANTLDDYEEGTFTPVLAITGYTFTFASQAGLYTKIGNTVFFKLYFTATYVSGSGTQLGSITGLPFASSGNAANYGGASWSPDTGSQLFSRVGCVRTGVSVTYLTLVNGWNGSGVGGVNWATMAAGTEFEISGHYFV